MEMAQSVARWFRLKQYQIEVTFGVYIFTPIEKFVFCKCHHVRFPSFVYLTAPGWLGPTNSCEPSLTRDVRRVCRLPPL